MKAVCQALHQLEGPAALATLVRVEGSAYRREGARMLIPALGEPVGMLSGGCLEADLIAHGRACLAEGRNELLTYDLRAEEESLWGLNLGCNGLVQVLVEVVDPAIFAPLTAEWALGRPSLSVVVLEPGPHLGQRLLLTASGDFFSTLTDPALHEAALAIARLTASDRPRRALIGGITCLIEPNLPPPLLWVVGAGPDALPLVELAARTGWRVHVVDRRPAYADPARFPMADSVACLEPEALAEQVGAGGFAVLMHHHFGHDRDYLTALLERDLRYLGLLGPLARTQKLLGSDQLPPNLSAPVGLDLGGEGAEAVALSIMAEVQAIWQGRSARHLRDQVTPEGRDKRWQSE